MVTVGSEVSSADMSVFVAPEEARVVVVDSPWMDLAIPVGVKVEKLTIPVINDPVTRLEADRVLMELDKLKAHTTDEDMAYDLNAIMADLVDDMDWWDEGAKDETE